MQTHIRYRGVGWESPLHGRHWDLLAIWLSYIMYIKSTAAHIRSSSQMQSIPKIKYPSISCSIDVLVNVLGTYCY